MPTSVDTGLSPDTRRFCVALVPASRLPGLLVGLLRNLISVRQKGAGLAEHPGPRLAHGPPTRSRPFCQPSPAANVGIDDPGVLIISARVLIAQRAGASA
jgi:hypothetical protein